jgi:hypothetical protein
MPRMTTQLILEERSPLPAATSSCPITLHEIRSLYIRDQIAFD